MDVSDLDEHFTIAEYQPLKGGSAIVRLVNGTLQVTIPYRFHSEDGENMFDAGVDGEMTSQQEDDLKDILADVLTATNAAIEAEHGWTKYT